MAFEYPTPAGAVHLVRGQDGWLLRFAGRQRGDWRTPDDAAAAVAYHQTGLPAWDRKRLLVPDDLLEWRPLGESL